NADTDSAAKLAPPPRLQGYTVIGEISYVGRATGRVYEVDAKGKERWSITDIRYPLSAQALRGDKVLVADSSGNVSERTTKGTTVWSKSIGSLLTARQLPNGRIFVVSRNHLLQLASPPAHEFAPFNPPPS